MGKRLVLAGGGHVHLAAMKRLREFVDRGHEVVLVTPDEYHYYSGMGPGMLGGFYTPEEIRFHVSKMVRDRGGRVVVGKVAAIRPDDREVLLSDGSALSYDVLSLNLGSRVPDGALGSGCEHVYTVKPIERMLAARDAIVGMCRAGGVFRVLVSGGGPAGVEVAGNVHRLVRQSGGRVEITLVAGRQLLRPFPEKVRRLARRSLDERGIRVLEGVRLERFAPGGAKLSDGAREPYDIGFLAVGVAMPEVIGESGLAVGKGGGLAVNSFLQSVSHPEVFGGGDCIHFQPGPLDKVGVYAVRENPVLMHNLLAALEGRQFQVFRPGSPNYLLLFNLGDGTAVLHKNGLTFRGRWAFALKDHIDRKFMRQFQVSGEVRPSGGLTLFRTSFPR